MTNLILIIAGLAIFGVIYAIVIRPWLKNKPWAADFFRLVEPLEIALFQKSETLLVGRLVWVGGLLVTLYDGLAIFMSSLDLTPLTTRIFDTLHIPTDMRGLATTAFIGAIGLLINWLRKRTSKPVEVVAVASKDITPAVAQALVAAEVTKQDAIAAVTEAKAA